MIPVGDLLEIQLSQGGASDDQAVIVAMAYIFKVTVKGVEMIARRMFRLFVVDPEQVDIHLQRSIAQQPQQLGFCLNLVGHQIEDQHLHRPYILHRRPALGHNEDILRLKNAGGWQVIGYSYGHKSASPELSRARRLAWYTC